MNLPFMLIAKVDVGVALTVFIAIQYQVNPNLQPKFPKASGFTTLLITIVVTFLL